jgi:hypothetical protein
MQATVQKRLRFQCFSALAGRVRMTLEGRLAPRVGIEPTTNGLTVRRSTAELPGNGRDRERARIVRESGRTVKRIKVFPGQTAVTKSA